MPKEGHNGRVTWNFDSRRLYLCTPLRDDLGAFVRAGIAGGVDIVQLREKHADHAQIEAAGKELKKICSDLNVPFIMNDSLELTLATEADGIHVGQDDIDVADCRRALGDEAIIGLSTHEQSEFDAGLATSATYLSAGPIVATPTKPGRPGTGEEYVRYALAKPDRPVFVTGGVDADAIDGLWSLGVRHFVVVRALTQSSNPQASARAIIDAIARCESR